MQHCWCGTGCLLRTGRLRKRHRWVAGDVDGGPSGHGPGARTWRPLAEPAYFAVDNATTPTDSRVSAAFVSNQVSADSRYTMQYPAAPPTITCCVQAVTLAEIATGGTIRQSTENMDKCCSAHRQASWYAIPQCVSHVACNETRNYCKSKISQMRAPNTQLNKITLAECIDTSICHSIPILENSEDRRVQVRNDFCWKSQDIEYRRPIQHFHACNDVI